MQRKGYLWAAGVVAVILLAPLLFAFVRTAMVVTMFEPAEGILGISGATLGKLAAGVIDLSVVGFIVGRMVAELLPEGSAERRFLSHWGTGGMVAVVATQVAVSFLIGGLSGWRGLLDQLDAAGLDRTAALVVSGIIWFLVSALIPWLIYILSEFTAHLIRLAILAPVSEVEQLTAWLEQSRAETEQAKASAEQWRSQAERLEDEAEQWRKNAENFQVGAEQSMSESRSALDTLNDLLSTSQAREQQAQAALEQQGRIIEHQQHLLEQYNIIDKHLVVRSYQGLLSKGLSERKAADQTGFSPASLNAWVKEVEQVSSNGHSVEVIG